MKNYYLQNNGFSTGSCFLFLVNSSFVDEDAEEFELPKHCWREYSMWDVDNTSFDISQLNNGDWKRKVSSWFVAVEGDVYDENWSWCCCW